MNKISDKGMQYSVRNSFQPSDKGIQYSHQSTDEVKLIEKSYSEENYIHVVDSADDEPEFTP